jgi:CheY-like chemotaxis protein
MSAISPPVFPPLLEGVSVLVVEDEPDARALVQVLLEMHKARVRTAGTSIEAIARFSEQKPDILICDIGLPGGNGYVLLKAIRSLPEGHGGSVPAIALTAFTDADARERAFEAGFQMYLTKPVETKDLLRAVRGLVQAN